MAAYPLLIPTTEEFFRLLEIADSRQSEADFFRVRGYYANTFDRHKVGALGEWAVWKWLYLQEGIKGVWWERYSGVDDEADIRIELGGGENLFVEVKSFSEPVWEEWGPSIPLEQYPRLRRRYRIVVWCKVLLQKDELDDRQRYYAVEIRGWNWIGEILRYARKEYNRDPAAYILSPSNLRSPQSMVVWIRARKQA